MFKLFGDKNSGFVKKIINSINFYQKLGAALLINKVNYC